MYYYYEEYPDKVILYRVREVGFSLCYLLFKLRCLTALPLLLVGINVGFGDQAFMRVLAKCRPLWVTQKEYPPGTKFEFIPRNFGRYRGMTFLSCRFPHRW